GRSRHRAHTLRWRPARRSGPVRRHRRRARVRGGAGRAAGAPRLRAGRGGRVAPSRTSQGGFPRRPGGPRARRGAGAAAGDGDGGGGLGAVRARQPRRQAGARAARAERADQARPGRVARRAGRRAAGVPRRGRRFPGHAPFALRAGRRAPRGGACGDEGGLPGARFGRGAQLRPVRRDDGRDGRAGPPHPLRLVRPLPRRRRSHLRPHARPRPRVGQPHPQHRHRLRLRRPPHRAALPRARAGIRPRAPRLRHAAPALPAGALRTGHQPRPL
ncbi:MAG: Putative phosphatase, partial [uncultured Gemmatimonadetes bacterium]